jgi:O-acetyl-ADP-ribose deacetylase (regulator of RNase III)
MDGTVMIREATGNLLAADTEALVNTVNTVGVMGKGIALQFRRAYPDMFDDYKRAVKDGRVQLGHMHVWPTGALDGPRYIINFPTKGHWRASSKLADIEAGLVDLVEVVQKLGIRSIALPPLGCGNGGLDWSDVAPRIRKAFEALPDVEVVIFPPGATPKAEAMPTRTARPTMTLGRAALVHILRRYETVAVDPSLVEVQKLLYFMQAAGQPLRLNFVKGRYGPYADNLRHVLATVEGHYLIGYGDGSSPVLDAEPIKVLPGADEMAIGQLSGSPETQARIDRVLELAQGFESMYGMELLASMHWVAAHEDPGAASDPDTATKLVQSWTPRKSRLFVREHLASAWKALDDHGWFATLRVGAAG